MEEARKPMSRQARRFIKRVEQEADATLAMLLDRFINYFIQSDNPEGQDVVDFMDMLCAQWKVYCHRKHLTPECQGYLERECKKYVTLYLSAKKAQLVPE